MDNPCDQCKKAQNGLKRCYARKDYDRAVKKEENRQCKQYRKLLKLSKTIFN